METATLYFSVCIITELKFVYNNDLHEKLIALFKGIIEKFPEPGK